MTVISLFVMLKKLPIFFAILFKSSSLKHQGKQSLNVRFGHRPLSGKRTLPSLTILKSPFIDDFTYKKKTEKMGLKGSIKPQKKIIRNT